MSDTDNLQRVDTIDCRGGDFKNRSRVSGLNSPIRYRVADTCIFRDVRQGSVEGHPTAFAHAPYWYVHGTYSYVMDAPVRGGETGLMLAPDSDPDDNDILRVPWRCLTRIYVYEHI